MTAIKVIAYVMHEHELANATNVLAAPKVTDAFVTGTATPEQIEKLRADGLIVQPVPAPGMALAETPGSGAVVLGGKRRPTVFSDRVFPVSRALDPSKPNPCIVEIPEPLLEENKTALAALGVTLLQSMRNGHYVAILTLEQLVAVRELPFVAGATPYDGGQTTPDSGVMADALAPAPPPGGGVRMLTIDVVVHTPMDMPALIDWLDSKKIPLAGTSRRKARVYMPEDSPYFAELGGLRQVAQFAEHIPPKLFDDRARALVGLDDGTGLRRIPFDGTGEIIGIADTGIDDTHPDFAGRLIAQIARGRSTADDPHGHGTHVAGTAVGDGSASGGQLRGAAPGARIVFQSLLDPTGGLGGLPLDLSDMFEEAYALGARIHNNSWGSETASTYTMNSEEVDAFAQRRQNMLLVFAAGNEGQAADRLHSGKGIVDWLSIGAPATAKNALTVGASRSDRSTGGYAGLTFGQVWSGDFPDAPIATEKVSGDPECLAGFSSRGPSDDRRIKPDIVAPGTDIASCRSSKAPLGNFWGAHPSLSSYAFMGGTSMAAPLVAGCAALVRQYYRQTRGLAEPSAALLKGTIINGARWLTGSCANASNPLPAPPPGNFDQGFGRIDLAATLPEDTNPTFSLAFVDSLAKPPIAFSRTGERRRYVLNVSGGAELRICLCYTDVEGRGLQNNLNLFVEDPAGTKLIGNHQLRLSLLLPDVDNNVEVVRVKTPATGRWLIQIAASNLLHKPQHFALVATGGLAGDLIPF